MALFGFLRRRRPVARAANEPIFHAQQQYVEAMDRLADAVDHLPWPAYYLMSFGLLVGALAACGVSMATVSLSASSGNEPHIFWGIATVAEATAFVMIAMKLLMALISSTLPDGKAPGTSVAAGALSLLLLVLVCTQGQIGRTKIEISSQDGEDRHALKIAALKNEIESKQRQISDRRVAANKMADQGRTSTVTQARQMNVVTEQMEIELQSARAKLKAELDRPVPVSAKRALKSEEAAGWLALAFACAMEVLAAAGAHFCGTLWKLGRRAKFVARGRLPEMAAAPAPLEIVPPETAPDRTVSGDAVRSDGTVGTVGTVAGAVLGTVGAGAAANEPPVAPVVPTVPVATEVAPTVAKPTVPAGWTYTPVAEDRTVPTVPGTVPTVPSTDEQVRRVMRSGRETVDAPSFVKKPAPVQADQKAMTKLAKDAAKDESEKLRIWALDAVLAGVKPSVSKLQDHRRNTLGAPGSRDLIAECLRWMTSEGWIEKGGRDNVLTEKSRAEQARRGIKG